MSVDTTDLELRVRTTDVEKADNRLGRLEKQAVKTEKATDGLTSAFKKMVGPLLALVSATAALNKLVEVQRQFDTLNAGLLTATKSADGAAKAFEALQDFAAKTPYDLAQAVDGFNKLVNLGLTPSEKALMSYGNTASAMGKDLNQMIEAVADAATGEFERLKEFGIKSSVAGKQVTFTFQGVATSVGNNAAEIEKYLTALGENQFAGAMEKRMVTLDGAISNLGDTWDMLFLNISKSGIGGLIEEQVRFATSALSDLNDMIASGEMDAYLQASVIAWAGWGKDITETIDILTGVLNDAWDMWGEGAQNASKGMYLGFKEFPVEIRAYFQEAAVEVTTFFHNAAIEAQYGWDLVRAAVSKDETFKEVTARYKEQMKQSNEVYDSMIDDISQEKDAALDSINVQIQAGKDLRTEYEKQMEARKKLNEDRLAGFKVGGDGKTGPTSAEQKQEAAKAKAQKKEFDALVASLNTQEEAIAASYEKRKAIIEKNTTAESAARSNLMTRLEKDRQKELDDLHGVEQAYEKRIRLAGEVAKIEESMWTDSQKAAAAYQEQIETLWQAQQAGVISAAQQKDMVNQVTAEYDKQQEAQKTTFLDLDELGKQAARNVQDAMADFLFDPFSQGLDGMLIGFLKVVQRMAAEAAAAQLASKLFGSSSGGSGSGWLGTLIGIGASFFGGSGGGALASSATSGAATGAANFGSQFDASSASVSFPGRASGGPTVAGQMYEVAENGPELYNRNGRSYLLDNQAGSVTPLSGGSQGASASGINVTVQVNVDNRGNTTAETSGGNVDDENSNRFAQVMKNVAVQAIREEQSPGGLLWNQAEGRNG
ncbi:tail tape measure protein [Pseudomonas phage Almagne]|nr:tail tape measure protein [Pseudomonas phage Almagne]